MTPQNIFLEPSIRMGTKMHAGLADGAYWSADSGVTWSSEAAPAATGATYLFRGVLAGHDFTGLTMAYLSDPLAGTAQDMTVSDAGMGYFVASYVGVAMLPATYQLNFTNNWAVDFVGTITFAAPALQAPVLSVAGGNWAAQISKATLPIEPEQWDFVMADSESDLLPGIADDEEGAEDFANDASNWVALHSIHFTYAISRYYDGTNWSPWSNIGGE